MTLGPGCKPDVVRARAAADLRCPEDKLLVEELPGEGFRVFGCGRSATYVCSGGTSPVYGADGGWGWANAPVACMREAAPAPQYGYPAPQYGYPAPQHGYPAPPPAQSSAPAVRGALPVAPQQPRADEGTGRLAASPFPTGVAGFSFGLPRAGAEAACLAAGEVARVEEGDDLLCSKPASPIGFDASVQLGFCGDALCRVDILTRPEREDGWTDRFDVLRRFLEERYGPPAALTSVLPEPCRARVSACLVEGAAGFWVTWKPASYQTIKLEMIKRSNGPIIRISYDRPVTATKPLL